MEMRSSFLEPSTLNLEQEEFFSILLENHPADRRDGEMGILLRSLHLEEAIGDQRLGEVQHKRLAFLLAQECFSQR